MDVSASWQYALAGSYSNSVECLNSSAGELVSWCENGQWCWILSTVHSMSCRGTQSWCNLCLFTYRPTFAMSFKKIVLKSTTMMSLNERWEATPSCWQVKPQAVSLVAVAVELSVGTCPTKLELIEAGEQISLHGDTVPDFTSWCNSWHSCFVLWVWISAYLDWGFSWFTSVSLDYINMCYDHSAFFPLIVHNSVIQHVITPADYKGPLHEPLYKQRTQQRNPCRVLSEFEASIVLHWRQFAWIFDFFEKDLSSFAI